jgi:phage shock protein A
MALIRRISRLFAADVHAVLDQIEDPEIVLQQAIREMNEELARQAQQGRWLAREIEAAGVRIAGLQQAQRELDGRLDLAFANGAEDLARKLTRRKLETGRLIEQHQRRRAELEQELAEHKALIASNEDQLEGMRQKAALLCPQSGGAPGETGDSIDDDELEIAYLREKQARTAS